MLPFMTRNGTTLDGMFELTTFGPRQKPFIFLKKLDDALTFTRE